MVRILIIFFLMVVAGEVMAKGAVECSAVGSTSPKPNSVMVSGKFYNILMTGKKKPGYCWRVRGRWLFADGTYETAHETTAVRYDGSWSLPVKLPKKPTINFILLFSPDSEYVKIVGQTDKIYQFEYVATAPATDIDTGTFTVNLSQSTVQPFRAGIGDVYAAAIEFFDDLDNTLGLYPKIDEIFQPIRIYYPNTWYDCHHDSNIPATCADDKRSKIWITRSDIASLPFDEISAYFTVMHELAHDLNMNKWHRKWPQLSSSGGSRDPKKCYTQAVALTEGFATALAAFGLYTEGKIDLPIKIDGIDLETPDRTEVCGSKPGEDGATNETWVTATFWDLIDHREDNYPGSQMPNSKGDHWHFPNPFMPFLIYLKNRCSLNENTAGCRPLDSLRDPRFLNDLCAAAGQDSERVNQIFRSNNIFGKGIKTNRTNACPSKN